MDDEHRLTGRVSRRKIISGAGSLGLAALAGCSGGGGGGDGDGGDGGGGGKLKIAQAKAPIEFDPIVLNDVPSVEIAERVFDPLYGRDESTGLVPGIAADMPEVERDAQRWIVPLNPDATFQNGDPVTAGDVAYSFTAPVEEETENAGEFNMIDTVEPVDEETVQFDLKFQFAAFKQYLDWEIVPKSVREEDKDAFNKESPVGAGPFTFEDWTEGEFVTISRWDDYWGDPAPNLAEIEFVPVEEGTTRITTLQSEENDVVKTIPPQSWQTVEDMDGASIESIPGVSYFYLAFNCADGPTAEPAVREAIDYAFSMDDAVSQFVEPSGIRQYSPIPQSLAKDWGFPLEEWRSIPHDRDVDRAKSMLDDSDAVPDDWSARIIVPPDDKREQIGVSVANGLKEAGYDATVQRLDWGAFLEQYITGNAGDYNMYTLGWSGSPDPDTFMYFLFAQESFETTNGTFYENDEVDEGIMTGRESNDRETRKQAYTDAITTILEDRVHIPSYNLKNSFGVRNNVSDFHAHPVDQFSIASDYNNVSVQ
ncbi:ABC transporter substrate-binding protein [Halobacteriales archaeon QS_1_68_17]|nr:MAG: ABC transporter substrate-binding protein [Halobacteriales archaeon QS_1_68_17]